MYLTYTRKNKILTNPKVKVNDEGQQMRSLMPKVNQSDFLSASPNHERKRGREVYKVKVKLSTIFVKINPEHFCSSGHSSVSDKIKTSRLVFFCAASLIVKGKPQNLLNRHAL